ncbi:ArsR family transcriptional regulator [Candidatus Bathyarchaeota archaeon]|nr:MAG: ArsR family transcriptional regulator [Candidatus Bathyarchaeota archaeon]
MQRSYERFSSDVLDAASAPVRLHILKLLVSKGPLPYTEIMYEAKMDPVRDAGKFVYHLKTLRKAGLVAIEKGTKKYSITDLGKILVEFSRDLEEWVAVKRGRLFVRTSKMTIEEFDRTRIASSLVTEAGMPQSLADEIASEAEERLLRFGTTYLTAPLVRELVNTILVERKLEEYRHKLTRLGLPVNDVTILLKEAGRKHLDSAWVQQSAGAAVTEEYVLLNSLPRPLVDAHFTGQIHLEDAESWILKPSIFFHDPRPFLRKGLPRSTPPVSFETALGALLRLARITEGQVASEQVFDHINVLLAPFIRGIPTERVQEAMRLFLYQLNWDGFSNSLPFRTTIGLDRTIPSSLEKSEAGAPNGKREGVFGDYAHEAEELFRTVIVASMEIARNNLLVNPSVTVNLSRERLSEPDSLLSMTYDASLKYSIPNYRIQDPEQTVTVSSDGNAMVTDDTNNIAGGAVVGTVQVNLPRISYEATGKDERFLQGVQNAVDEAVKALEIRGQAIQERMKEGLLPLLSWETDGNAYYRSQPMAEIGLLGLNEAVKHHTKKDVDAKDSLAFLKKIIEATRRAISESDNPTLRIRVGLHPSPEASSRLASIDAEKYGFSTIVYQGSKRHPYYTDVPLIPLTHKIPLSSRAFLEGEAQKLLDGGTILPLVMGEKPGAAGLARASQLLADSGVKHFTFSNMLSRCQFCYQVDTGVHTKCANCGSDKLTVVAKYAGRLIPLDLWTESRRRDLDRIAGYVFS